MWRYGAPRPASGGCDFAASLKPASTTTEILLLTAPGLWRNFSDNCTLASVVDIFATGIERFNIYIKNVAREGVEPMPADPWVATWLHRPAIAGFHQLQRERNSSRHKQARISCCSIFMRNGEVAFTNCETGCCEWRCAQGFVGDCLCL